MAYLTNSNIVINCRMNINAGSQIYFVFGLAFMFVASMLKFVFALRSVRIIGLVVQLESPYRPLCS